MSADTNYPIPTRMDADGVAHAQTLCTSTDDMTRPQCNVTPWTVVPVVFVPGIMGSNLKAKQQIRVGRKVLLEQGASVWDVSTWHSMLGWWGKSSSYRQAVMNHAAVMVDNGGQIAQGTLPTGDPRIPELMTSGETPLSKIAIAEAKKRGWGSPGWHYYGNFLDWLQYQLGQGALVDGNPNGVFKEIVDLVGTTPHNAESKPTQLTEGDVKKILDIHFPVYAVGYNWLQSNMDSGRDLVQGVGAGDDHVMGTNEIIARYDGVNGQTCKQVIVVTHSMGGLVARAAALVHGAESQILGIVHGVQPIDGAGAFYKRLAAGFEGEGWGLPWATSHVLGPTSKDTIPELAYNAGPLELAPNKRYNARKPWLLIKDRNGKVLKSLPENGNPYKEIYLDTKHVWRAVNPAWLNPADRPGNPFDTFVKVVARAYKYHEQLGGKLHSRTYAHWGNDPDKESWGSMTWNIHVDVNSMVGNPAQWTFSTPVIEAGTERDVLSAQGKAFKITVVDPDANGDGTVPSAASGAQIARYPGCLVACPLTGFDHQGDYDNDTVREVLLDALVRLVVPVKVT